MPAAAIRLPPLGDVDPAEFLATTWQRRPRLIRNALPATALGDTLAIRDVLALARDPDVESRLVEAPDADGRRSWRMRRGPFTRLPSRRRPGWTVLVQGVDLHLAAGRALMDRYRFIPDARLDDLMISVATDGGGVGPHVDSYDVFLLQAHGQRRWRVAPPGGTTLLPDVPLRILADFRPTESWTLLPGDLLYVPPGWAHEGTAIGECMTCSIGFRAPSPLEWRQAFFAMLADADAATLAPGRAASQRYRDRQATPSPAPAQIPAHMLDTLRDWIRRFRLDDALITEYIGCYLTEPKPNVWFDGTDATGDDGPDAGRRIRRGLQLDRRTRMLYAGDAVFINGEACRPAPRARKLLQRLADQRALGAVDTGRAWQDPALRGRLQDWLANGWLHHADE